MPPSSHLFRRPARHASSPSSSRHHRGTRSRTGAVTVEVAVVLPIFFMILLGSYDATRVNMLRHTAQASAYEGARRSIVPGATIEDVEADCRAIAATCGARDIRIQVIPAVITSDTKEVEVTVEIPLRSNTLVSSPFFGDMVLRGKTKFLRELK